MSSAQRGRDSDAAERTARTQLESHEARARLNLDASIHSIRETRDRKSLVAIGELSSEDDLATRVTTARLQAEKAWATWELMRDVADRLALGGVDAEWLLASDLSRPGPNRP